MLILIFAVIAVHFCSAADCFTKCQMVRTLLFDESPDLKTNNRTVTKIGQFRAGIAVRRLFDKKHLSNGFRRISELGKNFGCESITCFLVGFGNKMIFHCIQIIDLMKITFRTYGAIIFYKLIIYKHTAPNGALLFKLLSFYTNPVVQWTASDSDEKFCSQ
jgi:hypothetical protein